MSLPEGTLSFLFSDIEGSSHLWESDPKGMKASLVLHDVIMMQEIKANNGQTFKRVGDAFCAVFPTAVDALNCSICCQLRLNEPPPEGMIPLKVRIGIHTGIAELRENDYFGPTVNRVARIVNLGHGGQVLLSQVSAGLCLDHMPPRSELLEAGEVTLKSMTRPERIYQLYHQDIPSVFPPLRSNSEDIVTGYESSNSDFQKEAEATQAILSRAQQMSGTTINRDNLLRTAAELGISASAVAKAETEYRQQEQQKQMRSQFFKEQRHQYFSKWLSVFSLAFLMTGIWFLSGRGNYWPFWVFMWPAIFVISRGFKLIHDGPHLDESFEKWKLKQTYVQQGLPVPQNINVELEQDNHRIGIHKDL